MPTPLTLPYPPLILIQSDKPLTWHDLLPRICCRLGNGVSICLQTNAGHDNRGGYFFHFKKTSDGFVFRTFDRPNVLTLSSEQEVVAFINHCSGRRYDQQMWEQAQLVNFRTDEDSTDPPDR
ncbi:MAG: hypothetical protein KatS3mg109_1023 [Pirellulaceae bacterium]|nr:MAG: hypothetical protein KatS3mg109_1023 [Pirellulaceae bacterium]